MDQIKEVNALGRSGFVGELYNAREDRFLLGSIFKCKTEKLGDCFESQDAKSSELDFKIVESYTDKFEMMDIKGELKISLLAGLFELKGSGKYFNHEKKSSRTVRATVVYNIRTVQEKININHEQFNTLVSPDLKENSSATHFVGGILWGANSFVSIDYRKSDNIKSRHITGSLKFYLAKAKLLNVDSNVSGRFEEGDTDKSDHLNLIIYGDVIPEIDQFPSTLEQAIEILKKTPSYMSNCNSGKGKPITYFLYPIGLLFERLHFDKKISTIIHAINETYLLQIEQTFNDILSAKQIFNDFYVDVTSSSAPYFNETFKDEIATYKNGLEVAEADLRIKIGKALVLTREDRSKCKCLQEVTRDFLNSDYGPNKIRAYVDRLKDGGASEKLDFINDIREKGVIYKTFKRMGVDAICRKNENFYALVFREEEEIYWSDSWRKNCDLFFALLRNKTENSGFEYFVIETIYGVGAEKTQSKSVSIYKYINGVLNTADMLEDIEASKKFRSLGVGPKDLNLLLLGVSGSGKSTLINAVANYLGFESLKQAETQETLALIPTRFVITDDDFNQYAIEYGSDVNESGQLGMAQTRTCRSHELRYNGRRISIIDTPGIGCQDNVQKDDQTLNQIFEYVKNQRLNGICILVKQNEHRVRVILDYFLTEILRRLDQSLWKNLVFVFTHSRASNFRPDESLNVLRNLLKQKLSRGTLTHSLHLDRSNVYCVDNECFRYLVARKSDVIYSKTQMEDLAWSWKKSSEECRRLLDYFSSLNGSNIKILA